MGPINSGLLLLGQKMTQKSSFSNFDETFHFYSIFHVEYENQTQNSSKALKTEEGGVCLGPTLQKPSSRKSSAFDTQGLMGLGLLSHNRLNSYIFFIEFSLKKYTYNTKVFLPKIWIES